MSISGIQLFRELWYKPFFFFFVSIPFQLQLSSSLSMIDRYSMRGFHIYTYPSVFIGCRLTNESKSNYVLYTHIYLQQRSLYIRQLVIVAVWGESITLESWRDFEGRVNLNFDGVRQFLVPASFIIFYSFFFFCSPWYIVFAVYMTNKVEYTALSDTQCRKLLLFLF